MATYKKFRIISIKIPLSLTELNKKQSVIDVVMMMDLMKKLSMSIKSY